MNNIIICFIMVILCFSSAQIRWVETTQPDFADGYIDPNLYASWRANLDGDSGCVEWFPRFDLDNNGYPDFVSVDNRPPFFLRIWYLNSSGLDSSKFMSMGGSGGNCDIADLNTDGFAEIIHSGYLSGHCVVYWNDHGAFNSLDTNCFPNGNGEAVYVADFDADGYLDICIGGLSDVFFYWGGGGGRHGWSCSDIDTFLIRRNIAHNIEAADFDGDGDLDLLFVTEPYFLLRNDGGRRFFLVDRIYSSRFTHGLSVGDLDKDGDIDFVATNRTFGPAAEAAIYFNNGFGFFPDSITINPGSCYGGSALYDFNGDSWLDILFFRGAGAGSLVVYINSGGVPPLFSDSRRYFIGPYEFNSSGGTIIDANNDGNFDIFVNNYIGASYSILLWGPSFNTCDSFPVNEDHHGIFREPGNIRDRSKSAFYESNVFDTGLRSGIRSGRVRWVAYDQRDFDSLSYPSLPVPVGSRVLILARTGDTPTPDASWTDWDTLTDGGELPSSILGHRYIQYRAELWYTNPAYLPWLERIEFEFDRGIIDTIWFSEETDCDRRNVVRICYRITPHDSDSIFAVDVAFSGDSGITWTVPLDSIWDAEGDLGDSVRAGLHCFYWELGHDLPGVEGYYTARVIAQTGRCCHGETLRATGSVPRVLILGGYFPLPTPRDTTLIDTTINYVAGDTIAGHAWFADTTDIWDSPWGADLWGFVWCNRRYGWISPGFSYIHYNICSKIDTTVYLVVRADDDITVWIDGEKVFEEWNGHDDVHSYNDSFNIAINFSRCEWHSIYYRIIDYGGNQSISSWFTDLSGNPISWLYYSLAPESSGYSIADTAYYIGPLDSRPPRVRINCPDSAFFPGDTVHISWHVEDMFWANDPCSVMVDLCGSETAFVVPDTAFDLIIPEDTECDSVEIVVAARDSFCNWGRDTCYIRVLPRGFVALSFGDTLANPCRRTIVPLFVDSADCNIDRLLITFEVDTAIIRPVSFSSAISPTADSAIMRRVGTQWQIEFFWSTRVSIVPGVAGFLHLDVSCRTNAGDFSVINIVGASARFATVYWRDGIVWVNYKVNPWLVTVHVDDIGGDSHGEVTFGASYAASDGFDPWVDLLHLTPPPGSVNVWFQIEDSAHPSVTRLYRDIRDMIAPNQWLLVIEHPESTHVHWSREALGVGFYTLNGWLDMRTDTEYFAEPFETLTISWDLPRLWVDTILVYAGWNIISLPLRSPKPFREFIFRDAVYGPYEFDTGTRSFLIPNIVRFGMGYCVNSPADTIVIFVGARYPKYVMYVSRGWNILGCPSVAVDVADIGVEGTALMNIFEYDVSSGAYIVPDTLRPGSGYWFLMTNDGKIYVPR